MTLNEDWRESLDESPTQAPDRWIGKRCLVTFYLPPIPGEIVGFKLSKRPGGPPLVWVNCDDGVQRVCWPDQVKID